MPKKKRLHYGCYVCGGNKNPKKIPYGSKKGFFWCPNCDRDMVSEVNKKTERQKAKKEIKSQLDD